MSDETTPEQGPTETGGEDDQPSRIAGGCVLVALVAGAVLGLKLLVTAFPYIAYVVVGIIGTIGVQKARSRWGRTGGGEDQEQEEVATPDIVGALHRLVGDDKGVLLTVLRDDLDLPDTKAVKVLLEAEGIPWKPSRTRKGNGPAVRAESIPPAPSPLVNSHGDGCCCRSGDNNNANNGDEERFRVDHTDTGFTVRDLLNHYLTEGGKGQPASGPQKATDQ